MSNLLENMREKLANYFLQQKLKKETHEGAMYTLKTAKTAGILFDATLPDSLGVVKKLASELASHNIKAQALGYIHKSKREDNYIGDDTYNFISKKDLSFLMQPKTEAAQTFIQTPFNLLFVLSNKRFFAIDYISSLSKASFKTGKANVNNQLFDLMIELKDDKSLDELKTQIMHYLSMLNN